MGGARYLTGVSAVGGSWNPRAASCRQTNQRAGDGTGIISGQKGRRTVQVLNAGSMSNNCVGATINGLQGFAKCGPTSIEVVVEVVQFARSVGLKRSEEASCPGTPRSPTSPAYVYR